jgi:hypothetical protein
MVDFEFYGFFPADEEFTNPTLRGKATGDSKPGVLSSSTWKLAP